MDQYQQLPGNKLFSKQLFSTLVFQLQGKSCSEKQLVIRVKLKMIR